MGWGPVQHDEKLEKTALFAKQAQQVLRFRIFTFHHVSFVFICGHIGIILKGVAKLIATGRHIIR